MLSNRIGFRFVNRWWIVVAALTTLVSRSIFGFDTTAVTQSGSIRGTGAGVVSFKGIPYAAPPVERLRWRPPEPPVSWEGVRDATQSGPACPQPAPLPANEDCLTLNIWTPANTPTERLPVMVWIHGGGFVGGSGSNPLFDGESLARRGIVVVTLNYRLGALGFLAHPTLSAESTRGVSGNYGLLDQIAALRWVQANIGGFGGDQRNVTAFGQSGGAYSIAALMVSPLAKGLFQRAILQSLPLMFQPTRWLRPQRGGVPPTESQGTPSTPDIRALRERPAEDVVRQLAPAQTLSTGVHYYPLVDGWVLPADPADLVGTNRQTRIPVLIGYAADEGAFFLPGAPKTLAEVKTFIAAKFGDASVDSIIQKYHPTGDADAAKMLVTFFGDYEILASSVLTARAMARRAPVYLYQFSRVGPPSRRFNAATHTSEIPYVFGNLARISPDAEPQDRSISDAMVGAWVRFAKAGDPNGPGLPAWPRYERPANRYLNYGDTIEIQSGFREPQIEFSERLLRERRNPASP